MVTHNFKAFSTHIISKDIKFFIGVITIFFIYSVVSAINVVNALKMINLACIIGFYASILYILVGVSKLIVYGRYGGIIEEEKKECETIISIGLFICFLFVICSVILNYNIDYTRSNDFFSFSGFIFDYNCFFRELINVSIFLLITFITIICFQLLYFYNKYFIFN